MFHFIVPRCPIPFDNFVPYEEDIVTRRLNGGTVELVEGVVARQTRFHGYGLSTVEPLSNLNKFPWQPQQRS
jgi:hypothetical protein